ncbi:hypothetical protein D3C72_1116910 [compost metagenome]
MRNRDHQVHQQCDGAGACQQEFEHGSRGHVVGECCQERSAGGQHHRPVRCATFVGARGHGRCITALAQGEQHPRRGVERRVQAAGHSNQYHDVDDHLGIRDAHALKHGLVGAQACQYRVVPRHQGHNDEDRHEVEQADPPDHRVRGLGDLLARVFRFRGRDGHDLGTHEGEHGGQDRTEYRAHAVGQEAAAVEQMRNAADLAVRQKAEDRRKAEDDEADDCQHFDQCEPEFELAVILYAEQVGDGQQQGDDQRERPDADIREPCMENGCGGVGFQWNHQDPEPPVQPADGETGPVPDGTVGVCREGASVRRGNGHFAEHAHH